MADLKTAPVDVASIKELSDATSNGADSALEAQVTYIDPKLERKLVRKIDLK
jgi:hypothetical protein